MSRQSETTLAAPNLSRTMIHRALANTPTHHRGANEILTQPHGRARLLRATAGQLQTLLIFSGGPGLLLVPYHSDPDAPVECVLAPADLAPETWLAVLQPHPAHAHRDPRPARDHATHVVDPRIALREAALSRNTQREALSIAVRPARGKPWQALRVIDRTTEWGFAPVTGTIRLRRGGLSGMWALLCSVVDQQNNGQLGPPPTAESRPSPVPQLIAGRA